jgi:hypothetical protein
MADLVDGGRLFDMGILQKESLHKTRMDVDVDIFVYRTGNQEAAVFARVRWKIGAPSAQRDTQRRSRNNHDGVIERR